MVSFRRCGRDTGISNRAKDCGSNPQMRNLERVIPTQTMAEDCLDVMRSIVGIGENILIDGLEYAHAIMDKTNGRVFGQAVTNVFNGKLCVMRLGADNQTLDGTIIWRL